MGNCEGNRPSEAKACIDFCDVYGTVEAVPFQSNEFRQAVWPAMR
jgi:hypothetical protein